MEPALDQITHGDCIAEMRRLPDAFVQLVIADPPYNIGPAFGNGREWAHDPSWLPWCREWLSEATRVLRDDGNVFVFGIHHYQCYLQVAMYDLGLKYRRQIIWNYENGFSSPRRSLATHYEPILWFSKSDAYAFRELREPYKSTERLRSPITKNGKVWTPHPGGRIAGDVWRVPTLAGRRFRDEKVEHPTQKPLLLTDRIVRHFSDPGEVVLVPFAGSGTECLSAARSGRRFLGIELNAEYVNLARSRIASQLLAHAQAGTLFPRDEAEASEVA